MGITVPDGDTAAGLILMSKLKAYLRLTAGDSADDIVLVELGEGISAFVERYCDRVFSNESYIEYHDIMEHGQNELSTDQWPITNPTTMTVYSISWSNQVATETELDMDEDYWVYANAGLIKFASDRYQGLKRVKLVYEAGYAEIPNDLQFVIMSWVARKWKEMDRFGHSSQSDAIGSSTVYFSELTEEEWKILNAYKRKELC